MAPVKKIIAREILDSRGIPTIEGQLVLDNDVRFTAYASSGESLGKYEGIELRDGDQTRFRGLGVTKAVSYINEVIGPKLVGADPQAQKTVDDWLVAADGTENFSKLGVNTMMVISQLFLKAGAFTTGLPIYKYVNKLASAHLKSEIVIKKIPGIIVNLINGGRHGTKNLEFQEFHIIPSTSLPYSNALEMATAIYSSLEDVLDYRNAGTAVSAEGGFVPNLLTNVDALEIIRENLSQQKYRLGVDVHIGLDLAASQFFVNGKYRIKDKSAPLDTTAYIDFLTTISKDYPMLILEDPLEQEDFDAWSKFNEKCGSNIYITGDDFIAGKKDRLTKAIEKKAISAVVVKYNQRSTISELLELISQAKKDDIKLIFSQRLGESNDHIIADIAVGTQCDFVKFGAPVRGERVAKYNRLLEIAGEI